MPQTTPLFLRRQLALALPLVLATLAALTMPARSATSRPAPLSGSARPVIEHFLLSQTAGLPGKVGISIDTPMSGALPPCETLEPFLPSGVRLWGRVSVGVRCSTNQPWTRYVPAYIAVVGTYYVAARPINAGQALTLADAAVREGDLTTLPGSVEPDRVRCAATARVAACRRSGAAGANRQSGHAGSRLCGQHRGKSHDQCRSRRDGSGQNAGGPTA